MKKATYVVVAHTIDRFSGENTVSTIWATCPSRDNAYAAARLFRTERPDFRGYFSIERVPIDFIDAMNQHDKLYTTWKNDRNTVTVGRA